MMRPGYLWKRLWLVNKLFLMLLALLCVVDFWDRRVYRDSGGSRSLIQKASYLKSRLIS